MAFWVLNFSNFNHLKCNSHREIELACWCWILEGVQDSLCKSILFDGAISVLHPDTPLQLSADVFLSPSVRRPWSLYPSPEHHTGTLSSVSMKAGNRL